MENNFRALATKHYAAGNHFDELVDCYIKLDDFGKMQQLMHQLPDGHNVLLVSQIGRVPS